MLAYSRDAALEYICLFFAGLGFAITLIYFRNWIVDDKRWWKR